MEYGCYEEELQYSGKSMEMIKSLDMNCSRTLRLLLSNLISIYLKLGQMEEAKAAIEELSQLDVPEKDLNLFVHRGWMLYYGQMRDKEKSKVYLEKMYEDGLLNLTNRAFIIEFITDGIETMMSTGNKEKVGELMLDFERQIGIDEPGPRLTLCRLRIRFIELFGREEEAGILLSSALRPL